jgi:hypothetical protein
MLRVPPLGPQIVREAPDLDSGVMPDTGMGVSLCHTRVALMRGDHPRRRFTTVTASSTAPHGPATHIGQK